MDWTGPALSSQRQGARNCLGPEPRPWLPPPGAASWQHTSQGGGLQPPRPSPDQRHLCQDSPTPSFPTPAGAVQAARPAARGAMVLSQWRFLSQALPGRVQVPRGQKTRQAHGQLPQTPVTLPLSPCSQMPFPIEHRQRHRSVAPPQRASGFIAAAARQSAVGLGHTFQLILLLDSVGVGGALQEGMVSSNAGGPSP